MDATVPAHDAAMTGEGDGEAQVDARLPDPADAGALDAGKVLPSDDDGGGTQQHDAGQSTDEEDAAMPEPLAPGCGKAFASGRHMQSFEIDGVTRQVLFYIPQGYTAETPLPMTFNLHGSGGNPADFQNHTGIEPVADQKGFIVAAIAAYEGRWNVARSPDRPDDVKLAEAAIDWATENLCIDPKRVFSTGYSGGGRTSSRFACALQHRIRAIAPIAGVRHDPPCDVSDMPVLTMHGTGDDVNFYNGCDPNNSGCHRNGEWVESVEAAISDWRQSNGCTDNVHHEQLNDKVELFTWSECNGTAQVVFYKVRDGGHIWHLVGNTTEVVLDFFLAQPPR